MESHGGSAVCLILEFVCFLPPQESCLLPGVSSWPYKHHHLPNLTGITSCFLCPSLWTPVSWLPPCVLPSFLSVFVYLSLLSLISLVSLLINKEFLSVSFVHWGRWWGWGYCSEQGSAGLWPPRAYSLAYVDL